MAYFRFATYDIEDTEKLPFSAADYSKFKFGDGDVAENFGQLLAQSFIEKNRQLLLENEEIIVISSPYNSIPTASFYMTAAFKKHLNFFLFENGKKAAMDSKIHRYKTYSTDYGELDFEARKQLISTDKYHLDSLFLENRLCLFLDDVKITGSHEYVIKKQIIENNLEGKGAFGFLYLAELKNDSIAPQFENILNYAYVKGLSEIVEIMAKPDFHFNTRLIKYLLLLSDIELFLEKVEKNKQKQLIDWAISNNYHLMEEYQVNINKIIQSFRNQ
jgi:hypothetical protein